MAEGMRTMAVGRGWGPCPVQQTWMMSAVMVIANWMAMVAQGWMSRRQRALMMMRTIARDGVGVGVQAVARVDWDRDRVAGAAAPGAGVSEGAGAGAGPGPCRERVRLRLRVRG